MAKKIKPQEDDLFADAPELTVDAPNDDTRSDGPTERTEGVSGPTDWTVNHDS